MVVQVAFGAEVTGGSFNRASRQWTLKVGGKGDILVKVVVNCAGVFGDQVEKISHDSLFRSLISYSSFFNTLSLNLSSHRIVTHLSCMFSII